MADPFNKPDDVPNDQPSDQPKQKREIRKIFPSAPPIPQSRTELLAGKKTVLPNLNTEVDIIHLILYDDPEYRKFFIAIYNQQAIEGHIKLDDGEAAGMIRDHAKEIGNDFVAQQTKNSIIKALHVVAKRYGIDRKSRRELIEKKPLDDENDPV